MWTTFCRGPKATGGTQTGADGGTLEAQEAISNAVTASNVKRMNFFIIMGLLYHLLFAGGEENRKLF